jgi:inosose dehydratase
MATRPFKLGYSIISWGGTPDLDEALGAISGAGWEGAEFTGTSLEWLGTPRHLKSVFDRYDLPLVCIFGSVTLDNDRAHLERMRRRIEFAGEMGCEVFCLLGASRVHQRLPTDDEFKQLAEQAETFIDHAEPYGLKVAYHAHPRCTVESEEEQDQLLSHTDRLQVCIDVSVAGLMGEDACAQLRKYKDRLAYVHMKDWGRGKFCVMGQGTVGLDFGAVRGTLVDIGYDGWVMGELSTYADTHAVEGCYANRRYLESVGY